MLIRRENLFQILIQTPIVQDENSSQRCLYTCLHETAHYLHMMANPTLLWHFREDRASSALVEAIELVADYASIMFLDRAGKQDIYLSLRYGEIGRAISFYRASSDKEATLKTLVYESFS